MPTDTPITAISLIPNRDLTALESAKKVEAQRSNVRPSIRRPTRGIQLKEDTYATIQIVKKDGGTLVPLVDAGSRRVPKGVPDNKTLTDSYSNFLLQSAQDSRSEKVQILESFGEPYIFLFGEKPHIMAFSGVLLNTFDFNWEAEWWHNYDNYIRGTKCVDSGATVYLNYDDTVIGGFILSSNATKNSQDRNFISFDFQMFVTHYSTNTALGDPSAKQNLSRSDISEVTSLEQAINQNALPTFLSEFSSVLNARKQVDSVVSGKAKSPTLEEALTELLSPILNIWSDSKQVSSRASRTLNDMGAYINGTPLRVPVGFEGSMVFNFDEYVEVKAVSFGSAPQYTVFSANDDEYVDAGNHYVVAAPKNFRFDTEINTSDRLIAKAREEFKRLGLTLGDDKRDQTEKFFTKFWLSAAGAASSNAFSKIRNTGRGTKNLAVGMIGVGANKVLMASGAVVDEESKPLLDAVKDKTKEIRSEVVEAENAIISPFTATTRTVARAVVGQAIKPFGSSGERSESSEE